MAEYLTPNDQPTAAAMNALFAELTQALGKLFNGCSPYIGRTSGLVRPLVGAEFYFLGPAPRAHTASATAYDHAAYVAAAAAAVALSPSRDDTLRLIDVPPSALDLDGSLAAHTHRIGVVDYYLRIVGGPDDGRVQRLYRYAAADIVCEGVALVDLRMATKYDCFRIHNLSTDGQPLTATWGTHTVSVPARECRTVRRSRDITADTWHDGEPVTGRLGASSYFWPFLAGDPRMLNAGEGITRDPERSLSANNVVNPHVAHAWLDEFTRRDYQAVLDPLYARGFDFDPRLGPDNTDLYTTPTVTTR